jgi:hypothetical protein
VELESAERRVSRGPAPLLWPSKNELRSNNSLHWRRVSCAAGNEQRVCAHARIAAMFFLEPVEPPPVKAWVVASVASHHVGERSLNEINPGTGFERELSPETSLGFGHYLNSVNAQSVYAGIHWTPAFAGRFNDGYLRAGAMVGLATGYREFAPVVPMAGLIGKWESRHTGVNLMFVPNPIQFSASFFGLQLKRRMP